MPVRKSSHCVRRTALALATLCAMAPPVSAVVLVDGSWHVDGGSPVGPGDTLLPSKGLWIGDGAAGNLQVDGGSLSQIASLVFGSNQTGTGSGLITGAGSRIELTGNGFDQGSLNRFEVGGWGNGQFTVADGARLDGRANSAA